MRTRAMGAIVMMVAGALASADGAEYYSWIDANGVMVMTDDPNRIPPATQRSQVEIHRFLDPPAATSVPTDATRTAAPPPEPERPIRIEPRPDELPPVLLEQPAEPLRREYVWVPFQQAVIIGSNTVGGFWWHPGIMSSIDAFKAFLRQRNAQFDPRDPRLFGHRPGSPLTFRDDGNVLRNRFGFVAPTVPTPRFTPPPQPNTTGAAGMLPAR